MKIVRFMANASHHYGILDDDLQISVLDEPPFENQKRGGQRFLLQEVELLAPCIPSKIIGIGLNYRDHAAELGMPLPEEPMLFLKPDTAVIGHNQWIRYPSEAARVDFEAELGIVIGKQARRIKAQEAAEVILGYTCFNDVTARDLQAKDVQFTRAKGFDTFAPLGPWIVTDIDPMGLEIESYLNGEPRQRSNTRHLIFDPYALVHFISTIMTLKPGDVIASGTPSGIGPMQPGDRIEIRIEEIGSLCNYVMKDTDDRGEECQR
jgi:2-keto-4-pentenoate hydratase/2-oxohepta-3-ene-1,7-dioic acid hydratase in catechol pathway